MIYMINPIPETNRIKDASHIQSQIGNAKCITGKNVKTLLKNIKSNTTAYYELAFAITPEIAKNFKIKINCRRPDIIINTLTYGEKSQPYRQMNAELKQMFALNVVTGGSWSRLSAKIQKARFKVIEEIPEGKNTLRKIAVTTPKHWLKKHTDIFMIDIDPNTFKSDIQDDQRYLTEKEEIFEYKVKPKRKQFLLIIEPGETECIVAPLT